MTIANYLDLKSGVLHYKDTAPGSYHKVFVEENGELGLIHLLGVVAFRVVGTDVYGNKIQATVRREPTKRGNYYYWCAYKRVDRKLRKTYVGHDINLTIDNLVSAVQRLTLRKIDTRLVKGATVKVKPANIVTVEV